MRNSDCSLDSFFVAPTHRLGRWLTALAFLVSFGVQAGGTWSALTHSPPGGICNALLLGDGTVMCADGGRNWYRLTPDIHGSYINGTWSTLASMHDNRLFYASQVLTNGNVFVCGGEYGAGTGKAEIYNSLQNVWTECPLPGVGYIDAESRMLPDGNVLMEKDVYNVVSNMWMPVSTLQGQDEAAWVELPDGSVLTVDFNASTTERYIPAQNRWIVDATCPVSLYGYGAEEGAAILMANGKVFFIGGTVNTAIYTPSGTTANGSWSVGPKMVFNGTGLGAVDAPATYLANGNLLVAIGPTNGFDGPTSFYEYNYSSNAFAQVDGPTGLTYNNAPFGSSMLNLPDGTVFFIGGQGTTHLYVYKPDGTPVATGRPVINSISQNADGSYHLVGTGLNGISGGAAYGDDFQMDSNYPLIRMTNETSGLVYYARTHDWSTGVATGAKIVTTEFTLPVNLAAGTYSLVVTGDGIASAAVEFTNAAIATPTPFAALGETNGQISLSWGAIPGATSYNLKRYTSSGGPYFTLFTNLIATNYLDTGLINEMTYYYVVSAVGPGGISPYSIQAVAASTGPPPVPAGVSAAAGNAQVTLTWAASFAATSYSVQRSTIPGGPYTPIGTTSATKYTDTGVVNGGTYYYALTAASSHGVSGLSAEVSATPSTVLSGLVGYWKFDEGSGITANDSSGHTNIGTLGAGPSWVEPGKIGPGALQFNAAKNQFVTIPDSTSLDPTNALSITAWVYATNWTGNRRVLEKGNSDDQYRLLVENGVFKFDLTGVGTATTALPPTAQWVHVAGTWNGSTMSIYYNGVLKTSVAAKGTNATTGDALVIGAKNGSGTAGDYCQGMLDDVRVYNRALSAAEISIVMAPLLQIPTNLAATAGNGQVRLTWAASPGATSYNVKRSSTSGLGYVNVGNTAIPLFSDSTVTNGGTYYYVVTSVNASGESANSTEVSALPEGAPLLMPSFSSGQFSLQFSGSDGQQYIVQTSSNLIDWVAVFTNTQSAGQFNFTDTNAPGPELFYRVAQ
jgi:fibronectin type 3 domain-containing protein